MADNSDNIFEDGENLQAAIGKALQESKALLCFVADTDDESARWESVVLDERIRERIQSSTVLLRLKAGSEQAGFLNSVCPIQNTPAIVIIQNAQVVANYQNGQTTFEDLQDHLTSRYTTSESTAESISPSASSHRIYLDLPASEGRMRLPNNAYDQLRKLTQQYVSAGLSGQNLLNVQLRLLDSLKIDVVSTAVESIRQDSGQSTEPTLTEEVVQRLLNTPASRLQAGPANAEETAAPSNPVSAASQPENRSTLPLDRTQSTTNSPHAASARQLTAASSSSDIRQPSQSSSNIPSTSTSSQRAQYIAAQKSRESAQSAERERIKAQIAADKAARRESEAAVAAEQRRIDLLNLRKANSTTSNPKASDVRIQVRLFDGSTIRNSFPAEATVAKDVRGWIDGEVRTKAATGGAAGGQPYDLKLILTPVPNRTIEAGEEDGAISDLEGVRGSATMVMVPVRGYVDSYSGSSGGIVGGVVGGATSVVGAGLGLVGSAAGILVGGFGRLLGAGGAQPVSSQARTQPQTQQREDTGAGQTVGTTSGRSNVRVRTLANQRQDEEDDRRKRGADLYNGMGLNVQPRKDDDEAK